MKKLRTYLEHWSEKLEERWKLLPIRKQQHYTFYFFTAYLILTAGVLLHVCKDAAKSYNNAGIDPVLENAENPVSVQDTLPPILKNNLYGKQ